jgi:hypothetical protein
MVDCSRRECRAAVPIRRAVLGATSTPAWVGYGAYLRMLLQHARNRYTGRMIHVAR